MALASGAVHGETCDIQWVWWWRYTTCKLCHAPVRGITAETALRLARYFGTDAESWMNLQHRYELALAKWPACEALSATKGRKWRTK